MSLFCCHSLWEFWVGRTYTRNSLERGLNVTRQHDWSHKRWHQINCETHWTSSILWSSDLFHSCSAPELVEGRSNLNLVSACESINSPNITQLRMRQRIFAAKSQTSQQWQNTCHQQRNHLRNEMFTFLRVVVCATTYVFPFWATTFVSWWQITDHIQLEDLRSVRCWKSLEMRSVYSFVSAILVHTKHSTHLFDAL